MPVEIPGILYARQRNTSDSTTSATFVAIDLNDRDGNNISSLVPANGVTYLVWTFWSQVNANIAADFAESEWRFGATVMGRGRAQIIFPQLGTNLGRGEGIGDIALITGDGVTAITFHHRTQTATTSTSTVSALEVICVPVTALNDLHSEESANSDSAVTTPTSGFTTAGNEIVFTPANSGTYVVAAAMEMFSNGDLATDITSVRAVSGNTGSVNPVHEPGFMDSSAARAGDIITRYRWVFTASLTGGTEYRASLQLDGTASTGGYSCRRIRYHAFRADSVTQVISAISTAGVNVAAAGTSTLSGSTMSITDPGVTGGVLTSFFFNGHTQTNFFAEARFDIDGSDTQGFFQGVQDNGAGAGDDVGIVHGQATRELASGSSHTAVVEYQVFATTGGTVSTLGRARGNGANGIGEICTAIVWASPNITTTVTDIATATWSVLAPTVDDGTIAIAPVTGVFDGRATVQVHPAVAVTAQAVFDGRGSVAAFVEQHVVDVTDVASATWTAIAPTARLQTAVSDISTSAWTVLAPSIGSVVDVTDVASATWTALDPSFALGIGVVDIATATWTVFAPSVRLEVAVTSIATSGWTVFAPSDGSFPNVPVSIDVLIDVGGPAQAVFV